MGKNHSPNPRVRKGHFYCVEEWDGSRFDVQVLRRPVSADGVRDTVFRYEDGLTHRTKESYFKSIVRYHHGPEIVRVPMFPGKGLFGGW